MIDHNTDFFKIVDNFSKTVNIPTLPIFNSQLDNPPKVTIAIPTFNRPRLLKEAIDSALNQTGYSEYEVIVVDNNPERGCETERLLQKYTDNRLSYYKNSQNLGMVDNWNRCFALSNSEWLVLLHDDDLLELNFLSVCMQTIKSIDNIGALKPLYKKPDRMRYLSFLHPTVKRVFDFDNFFGFVLGAPTGCFFKRNYVIKLGGFNNNFYPNFDFYFMVLFSKYYKVVQLRKELITYRIMENESMKINTINQFFKNDSVFQRTLMREYNIYDNYITSVLSIRFLRLIRMYQKNYNQNFKLNLNSLNLKNSTNFFDYLYYFLVKFYVIYLNINTRLKIGIYGKV